MRFRSGDSVSSVNLAGMGATVKDTLPLGGIKVLTVKPGSELSTVAALQKMGQVQFAAPNYISQLAFIPNDPLYSDRQWNMPLVHAPEAWDTQQGAGPIVGIIDSGLDYGHPDFIGRSLQGAGKINCGENIEPDDDLGHGTHVSGIIGAASNNEIGVAGIAWNAQLLPFKAASSTGRLCDSDWIYGLGWLLDHGAKIINMSFAGLGESDVAQAAVTDAWNRGALLVAAAGNNFGPSVNYPASYDHVISVGSIGFDNLRSDFSDYNAFVDMVAPGGGNEDSASSTNTITSTFWRGAGLGDYAGEKGTSQAAPHVSGAAALLLSDYPNLTNVELEHDLISTAVDMGTPGRDDEYGYGLLNIAAALHAAQPTPTLPPGCVFTDVCDDSYFYTPVEHLLSLGALSGYDDDTFRPYNDTTRGQVCKILVIAEGWAIEQSPTQSFSDVTPDNPFFSFIETAYARGVISGYNDGAFRWSDFVTRGQLAKIITQAQGWATDTSGAPHFSDVDQANPFYNVIETAYNKGIISGYSDGTFNWSGSATRGQISKIVYQAINAP